LSKKTEGETVAVEAADKDGPPSQSKDAFPQEVGGGFATQSVLLKEKQRDLLIKKLQLQRELPHLYGWKFYDWQRKYLDSTNHEQFITAANQIGKSTIQVVKCVDLATNISRWPSMWRVPPRVFWYMYPSQDLATQEVLKKWIPDVLPRGAMKDHPQYGWQIEKRGAHVHAIHFNSGVSIYMKTYSQDISYLQAATCWFIFCDEELPEEFWDEINFRRQAHNGYFSMVFTATLGQKLWFDTMERVGEPNERFKDAFKQQVSLFQCKKFEDGTDSHWTDESIRRVISFCKSEAEVQRRVYGRFVIDGGLKYSAFDRKKNICTPHPLPPSWRIYAGVDIGAGGTANHPSTIVFCAVDPSFTKVRVIKAWKGSKQLTTDMDVVQKLKELIALYKFDVTGIYYDYHAKDFGTIAIRMGLPVHKAEKRHDIGESVLNVLFKHECLKVFDIPEMEPLIYELTTLLIETDKRKAVDDLADATRYCLTKLPFPWDKIGAKPPGADALIPTEVKAQTDEERVADERRARFHKEDDGLVTIEQEFEAWNELYDYDAGSIM
jgi:hypothetical protein